MKMKMKMKMIGFVYYINICISPYGLITAFLLISLYLLDSVFLLLSLSIWFNKLKKNKTNKTKNFIRTVFLKQKRKGYLFFYFIFLLKSKVILTTSGSNEFFFFEFFEGNLLNFLMISLTIHKIFQVDIFFNFFICKSVFQFNFVLASSQLGK